MKFLLSIILLITNFLFSQELQLNSLFSDNMVLQRNQSIELWGTSLPESKVDVKMLSNNFSTYSDINGDWKVDIGKYDASGPHTLTVISNNDSVSLSNILIGDVWICSGQSNMNMPMAGWGRVNDYESEISKAVYPNIRLLAIPLTVESTPKQTIEVKGWEICSPKTVEEFSAVAYYYAKEIYEQTNIPIGLIHVSKGGTPIESWMCEEALSDRNDLSNKISFVKQSTKENFVKMVNEYKRELKNWYNAISEIDEGLKPNQKWYSIDYDISQWNEMILPGNWEKVIGEYDGVVWFVKDIVIPENWLNQNLTLNLGPVQDYDVTFFNGQKIGQQLSRNDLSIYEIPSELIRVGKNRITVRVLDLYGPGGMWGVNDKFEIFSSDGNSINLKGEWKYKPSINLNDVSQKPPVNPNPDRLPTVLFNGMISPILNYKSAGVIWYQGESNSRNAFQYREMFKRIITHWREHFNNPDLNFYFVQLANYMKPSDKPVDDIWPVIRESQSAALQLPRTGMACAIDIGDEVDVHPKNKAEVGRRLALNALHSYYGYDIPFSGPVYKSFEVNKDTVIISFDFIYDGLVIKNDDSLNEFTIAGADKKFYNAEAWIAKNKVYVRSSNVSNPVAVRYAWENNPKVNFYNSAQLPAVPFRTDNWDVVTQ